MKYIVIILNQDNFITNKKGKICYKHHLSFIFNDIDDAIEFAGMILEISDYEVRIIPKLVKEN